MINLLNRFVFKNQNPEARDMAQCIRAPLMQLCRPRFRHSNTHLKYADMAEHTCGCSKGGWSRNLQSRSILRLV